MDRTKARGRLPQRPPQPENVAIGQRLLWSRLALNMQTQGEMADSVGIARNTYTAWEVGSRKITLNGALAICKAHGLSMDWIYFDRIGTIDDPALKKAIADIRLSLKRHD